MRFVPQHSVSNLLVASHPGKGVSWRAVRSEQSSSTTPRKMTWWMQTTKSEWMRRRACPVSFHTHPIENGPKIRMFIPLQNDNCQLQCTLICLPYSPHMLFAPIRTFFKKGYYLTATAKKKKKHISIAFSFQWYTSQSLVSYCKELPPPLVWHNLVPIVLYST